MRVGFWEYQGTLVNSSAAPGSFDVLLQSHSAGMSLGRDGREFSKVSIFLRSLYLVPCKHRASIAQASRKHRASIAQASQGRHPTDRELHGQGPGLPP